MSQVFDFIEFLNAVPPGVISEVTRVAGCGCHFYVKLSAEWVGGRTLCTTVPFMTHPRRTAQAFKRLHEVAGELLMRCKNPEPLPE